MRLTSRFSFSASSFVLEVRGGEETGGIGLIIWELHKGKHAIGMIQSSFLEAREHAWKSQ